MKVASVFTSCAKASGSLGRNANGLVSSSIAFERPAAVTSASGLAVGLIIATPFIGTFPTAFAKVSGKLASHGVYPVKSAVGAANRVMHRCGALVGLLLIVSGTFITSSDLNPIAESTIHTIDTLATAFKLASGARASFWPYLIRNAVDVHNSTATSLGSSTADSQLTALAAQPSLN